MRTYDRAELKARLRQILTGLELLRGETLEPMDSLAIVLLFTEIEQQLGCALSPVGLDRESFASLDTIVDAIARLLSAHG